MSLGGKSSDWLIELIVLLVKAGSVIISTVEVSRSFPYCVLFFVVLCCMVDFVIFNVLSY